MGFIKTNVFAQQILDEIKKEKILAHDLLMENLKALFDDGKKCLKDIEARCCCYHERAKLSDQREEAAPLI